jgi:LytS/YehU family sensor histidine kinase
MNPHFIFNALNSIQDYIVLNERKLASSFLVKFSRLIRIYLEQGQQNEIYLNQEIEALRLYLELEKVRFEEKLTYEIIIDDELDLTTIKIPSLLIQPYIENALKHGLLHKKSDRSLSVRFSLKSSKVLECIIEDNGVGRSVSHDINLSRKEHRSFATQATEKRVELINEVKSNNDKIQIKIDDLFSATMKPNGTRVNILIPFK